jgi:hypothetical protein
MNSAAKTGCCIDLEAELDGALFASVRDDRFENPSAKAVCEKIRVSELLIELSPLYSVRPTSLGCSPSVRLGMNLAFLTVLYRGG